MTETTEPAAAEAAIESVGFVPVHPAHFSALLAAAAMVRDLMPSAWSNLAVNDWEIRHIATEYGLMIERLATTDEIELGAPETVYAFSPLFAEVLAGLQEGAGEADAEPAEAAE